MPEAYDLHDGRFLQYYSLESAPGALDLTAVVVPEGKVRTILAARYNPSVAETKQVAFYIVGRDLVKYMISIPSSIALAPAMAMPGLTDGMELKLFPGEALGCVRDSATAGSTMFIKYRFIETDLPYYSYVEPQAKVLLQRHGSAWRSTGGSRAGGGGGGRSGEGGGGGPQPI